MTRKAKNKDLERRKGWFRVRESGGSGKHRLEWDVTIDLEFSSMTFDDLRERMVAIEAEHGAAHSDFKVECEREHYRYEDGDYLVFRVYGYRSETDAEYQDRLDQLARQEEIREARERAEFERLAKKFANKE